MVPRPVLRAFSTLALASALLGTLSRPAFADAKTEAAAKALEQKAMQEDYLNTDFDKAIDKLRFTKFLPQSGDSEDPSGGLAAIANNGGQPVPKPSIAAKKPPVPRVVR